MTENVFYFDAKNAVLNFLKKEFPSFPAGLEAQFLNFFSQISIYEEEGIKIRPNILFTNNIDAIVRAIPTAHKLTMFTDPNESMFSSRMKSLIPFCKNDWMIYVNIKEDFLTYGICKALNSIKEKSFNTLMFESSVLKEKTDKIFAITTFPLSAFSIKLSSLKGESLNINFTLNDKKVLDYKKEIKEFVDANFSKLRTTQQKLQEIKTLYQNIFENVFMNVAGTICVVVDKNYKLDSFFKDGIWLKEPIEFSKLFLQSKSYSEPKLLSFAQLFTDMLNYDGITIVDNAGRVRAYNVFIESNTSTTQNIIGGARKRAAYTIINGKLKDVIGVYFQSHDGEMFYQPVKKVRPLKPRVRKAKITTIAKELEHALVEQNKLIEST